MMKRFYPLYFIFALYLLFGPYLSLPDTNMYDSKRLLEIVLLSFAAIVLCFSVKEENVLIQYFNKTVTGALLVFLGIGIISSLVAPMTYHTIREVVMFVAILFMVVMLGIYIQPNVKQYQLFVIFTAIGYVGIYSIYFFGNYISAHLSPLVPLWPDRLGYALNVSGTNISTKEVLNFVNRRFFNHIQTWTFPLLATALVYVKKQKVFYWLLFFLLSIWWMLVIASGARGTAVSIIASGIFIFLFFRGSAKDYIAGLLFSVLGGIVLYYVLYIVFSPVSILSDPILDPSGNTRLVTWGMALEQFWANPILGAGPYHFSYVQEVTKITRGHPHNFYLQILTEWGLIAFMVFSFLLYKFVKCLIKSSKNIKDNTTKGIFHIGFTGAIVAALVHALVSGIFHTPMSQVWFILIAAYFVGFYLQNRTTYQENDIKLSMIGLKVGLMCLTILFASFAINDFQTLNRSYSDYHSRFETNRLKPRFWGQGLIYDKKSKVRNSKKIKEKDE